MPRKMATPVGWKTARCSSLGQPRTPHQIVGRMPPKPVVPPRMPLRNPTPPSATRPPAVSRAELRPHQAVDAEQDQEDADGDPQIRRRRPAQELDADGYADHPAQHERQQAGQAEPAPQFPDGVALYDQAESHDQGGRLQWRQHMQPDRRRDQAEGEAGHAGDQGRAEGRGDEERQVERKDVTHVSTRQIPARHGSGSIARSTNSVTLSALDHRATPPGSAIRLSVASNRVAPSKNTAKRSPIARRRSVCH